MVAAGVTVPQEMVDAIENVGFLASIPLWLVAMLGNLFITVMSFILIMTVYGRFFRLYIFTALAPIPLATFAGEGTSFAGKQFIKSYIGVCMEGAVIVLACLIFFRLHVQRFPGSGHQLDPRGHGLAVHRGDYFQYAGVGWPGKGCRAYCARIVRPIKKSPQFEGTFGKATGGRACSPSPCCFTA